MNALSEFFPAWTYMLGWTLLNSLWQALLVTGVVALALRMLPASLSQWRYRIACGGMFIVLFANIATFFYFADRNHSFVSGKEILFTAPDAQKNLMLADPSKLNAIDHTFMLIDSQMPFIILCWAIGAILFSLRMITGWWYMASIRSEASALNDEWYLKLQQLAQHLEIKRIVRLAQSTRIYTPIVTGWLKPVILIPVGMLSGLTTEQVETIFIHELAHIKRHDYLINLIQCFIEALFFFNPFVWMISGMIRREREYCCDDTVIKHGSALAYARALTQLEEVRLSKSMFALSLAENKNQLLNRIKRIMEKSARNYSVRERMIPAALLMVGLICASWLTIKDDRIITQDSPLNEAGIAADTIDKKNGKSATYSKKVITTYDANGEPRQQIVENFEGDEELRSIVPHLAFDFQMPQFPVIPSFPGVPAVPGAPGVPDFDVMIPPFANLQFDGDSIPRKHFSYRTEKEWEEFSKAFEEKFSKQFGEFYNTHEKDLEKMMEELEETFTDRFNEDELAKMREHAWELSAHGNTLAEMARTHEEVMREAAEHARQAVEKARENFESQHEAFEKQDYARMFQRDQFTRMEERLKNMEVKMESFKKELKEMLVEDGYINKNDEIKNINWDDDGEIEVNGQKIKDSDRKKYNELHNKYFDGDY